MIRTRNLAWARDKKMGASLINARADTVATKPSFRTAFQRRR
jgi:putative SOS response-associated peptidase YedK